MKRKLLNTKKDIALQSERERKKEYEGQGREGASEREDGSAKRLVPLSCLKTNCLYTIWVRVKRGRLEDKERMAAPR